MPHAHYCPGCSRSWRHALVACPDYRVEDDGLRTWTESAPMLCRDCAEVL